MIETRDHLHIFIFSLESYMCSELNPKLAKFSRCKKINKNKCQISSFFSGKTQKSEKKKNRSKLAQPQAAINPLWNNIARESVRF